MIIPSFILKNPQGIVEKTYSAGLTDEMYDCRGKEECREFVWEGFQSFFIGNPNFSERPQILLMPGQEDYDIQMARNHGFPLEKLVIVEENPARLAILMRKFPLHDREKMLKKGKLLSSASLDLAPHYQIGLDGTTKKVDGDRRLTDLRGAYLDFMGNISTLFNPEISRKDINRFSKFPSEAHGLDGPLEYISGSEGQLGFELGYFLHMQLLLDDKASLLAVTVLRGRESGAALKHIRSPVASNGWKSELIRRGISLDLVRGFRGGLKCVSEMLSSLPGPDICRISILAYFIQIYSTRFTVPVMYFNYFNENSKQPMACYLFVLYDRLTSDTVSRNLGG